MKKILPLILISAMLLQTFTAGLAEEISEIDFSEEDITFSSDMDENIDEWDELPLEDAYFIEDQDLPQESLFIEEENDICDDSDEIDFSEPEESLDLDVMDEELWTEPEELSISCQSTLLAAPGLVSAVNSASGVNVKWMPLPQAVKYRVFYKINNGTWTKAGDTTGTTYTVSGLNTGWSYWFTVRAISADGKSYTSEYDKAGLNCRFLGTPKLNSAVTAANGITVTWNALQGAAKYRVFYRTNNGSWTKAGDTAGTSYTVTGLNNGWNYWFTVRAVNEEGGATSNYDVTGLSCRFVGTPKLISAATASNGISVKWESLKNAVNYRVFYKTVNGTWKKAGDTTGTAYTVTGLNYGEAYWFTVRAVSADGKSYASNYDAKGLSCQFLYTPKLLSAVPAENGVTVKWESVNGASRYRVFFKTNTGSWTKAGDTAGTSYVVSGLNTGWTYWFTVRAISSDGKMYTSNYDTKGLSCQFLGTPKLRSAVTTANGITVNWEALSGAAKYRVFYKTSNGSWTKAGDTTNISYTVTGLNNGWTYWFTVRAISSDGKTYTSKYDSAGLTCKFVGAPKLSSVINADNGVTVKWEALKNAAKYRVFYKTTNGQWTKAGDTAGTSYMVTGLNTGWTYIFTVRAISEDGKTYTSNYDSNGKRIQYLGVPRMISAEPGKNGVTVKWEALKGAKLYWLFSRTGNGAWVRTGETSETSFLVPNLVNGETYYFTVRSVLPDYSDYTSRYDLEGVSVEYFDSCIQAMELSEGYVPCGEGEYVEDENYACTDVFLLEAGQTVEFKAAADCGVWLLSEWSEDGKLVRGLEQGNNVYRRIKYTADVDVLLRACTRCELEDGMVYVPLEEFSEIKIYDSDEGKSLAGKTIVAIGDSLFYGDLLGNDSSWLKILENATGATVYNCGICGNSLASAEIDPNPSMAERCKNANGIQSADMVLILGGANDFSSDVPLGTLESRDIKTFMGACNKIIESVREINSKAIILFFSPYCRYSGVNSLGLTEQDYANAMFQVCAAQGVPCYDNQNNVGVSFVDSEIAAWCDEGYYLQIGSNEHFSPRGYDWLASRYIPWIEQQFA